MTSPFSYHIIFQADVAILPLQIQVSTDSNVCDVPEKKSKKIQKKITPITWIFTEIVCTEKQAAARSGPMFFRNFY